MKGGAGAAALACQAAQACSPQQAVLVPVQPVLQAALPSRLQPPPLLLQLGLQLRPPPTAWSVAVCFAVDSIFVVGVIRALVMC